VATGRNSGKVIPAFLGARETDQIFGYESDPGAKQTYLPYNYKGDSPSPESFLPLIEGSGFHERGLNETPQG